LLTAAAAVMQDFSDDPCDANKLVYLAADLLTVLLHTLHLAAAHAALRHHVWCVVGD
jgi:hypothetical protein